MKSIIVLFIAIVFSFNTGFGQQHTTITLALKSDYKDDSASIWLLSQYEASWKTRQQKKAPVKNNKAVFELVLQEPMLMDLLVETAN